MGTRHTALHELAMAKDLVRNLRSRKEKDEKINQLCTSAALLLLEHIGGCESSASEG